MTQAAKNVVAVVDDDFRSLESIADLLEAAGYDVRLYSSARTLWEGDQLAEIDCLISDIGMPDIDGLELRRLVLGKRPALPVILITGRPGLRTKHPSITAGNRYFQKPFDGQELLAAVSRSLRFRSE
jgi:FixJ family two-component response regulator